jgi:hypothetical protein
MNYQLKKYALHVTVSVIALLVVPACNTVKKLPATVAGASRAKFVGTWTLSKVSYDGLLPGSVQSLFEQASPESFNGSTWKLTNSGNGSFSLLNGTSQAIFWSYDNNNGPMFQFKKLYQGHKARKVQEGYRLTVRDISDNQMTLTLPVNLGDRTAFVILDFDKVR